MLFVRLHFEERKCVIKEMEEAVSTLLEILRVVRITNQEKENA